MTGLWWVLGIAIFLASFAIVDWISPYKLWEEVVENKNTALAILVGSVSLGMCIIIAASVH